MNITFSGIDEFSNIDDLKTLDVEYGVLLSLSPKGRNRYPNLNWIEHCTKHLNCALHICGSEARSSFLKNDFKHIIKNCQRIQVNGKVDELELDYICKKYYDRIIITQHNEHNIPLLDLNITNHAILCDASGGRGIVPNEWPILNTEKKVGYAGGLGKDNIYGQIRKIQEIDETPAWIDMETKLRDEEDKFSFDECVSILELINFEKVLRRHLNG